MVSSYHIAFILLAMMLLLFPRALSATAESPSLPEPQWTVMAVSAAPDGKRAAIFFTEMTSDEVDANTSSRHVVAIFDLESGKRLSQAFPVSEYSSYSTIIATTDWSPDGEWYAYIGRDKAHESEQLWIVGRNGLRQSVPNTGGVCAFIWSPETAATILYTSCVIGNVSAYHVTTGRTRTMLHGGGYRQLFIVRGKACVSELSRRREGVVREITSRRRILTVPYHDYITTDRAFWLSMSPDGKYFAMSLSMSGWTGNVIARAADARHVLRTEHIAIFYQNESFGSGFPYLTWPSPPSPTPPASDYRAWSLSGRHVFFGHRQAIELKTGSRGEDISVAWGHIGYAVSYTGWRWLASWPKRGDLLIMTERGLYAASQYVPVWHTPYDPETSPPPLIPHPLPESALFGKEER